MALEQRDTFLVLVGPSSLGMVMKKKDTVWEEEQCCHYEIIPCPRPRMFLLVNT